MIIPLGHDELSLRRWPLVSFAIMALCAAAFAASTLAARPDPDTVRERLGAALSYYLEHPRLEADARLRGALEREIAALEPAAQEEVRRRLDGLPEPSPLDGDRQQHLDALTADWLATLQVGPLWQFGLVPALFSADRLLTHLFVHVGFLHLLFNMLFFYLCGPSLEDAWGRAVFTLFYVGAGVASALCFVALYPDLAIPLVGASGAIAGAMGAFLVRFPRAQIRLFYVWMLRVGTTTMPAWVALLLWVGGEVASGYAMDQLAPGTGGAGVAHWGHVAGFAFGVVFAVVVGAARVEERIEARAAGEDRAWHAADRALARNDRDEAWRILRDRVLQHPADRDAALAYWDLAHELGRSRQAIPVLLRLIRGELDDDEEAALRHWDELVARVPDAAPPVDLAVKLARCIVARRGAREAVDLLRAALRRVDAATEPTVVAELAATAARADAALAAEAAARALGHPALPRGERAALERLAAGVRVAPAFGR